MNNTRADEYYQNSLKSIICFNYLDSPLASIDFTRRVEEYFPHINFVVNFVLFYNITFLGGEGVENVAFFGTCSPIMRKKGLNYGMPSKQRS